VAAGLLEEVPVQLAWGRCSGGSCGRSLSLLAAQPRPLLEPPLTRLPCPPFAAHRPRINGRSGRLMSERVEALKALQLTAHEQLFQDAQRRQQK
jgi:hypothetical protein